jgi:hypothetical protein
VTIVVVIQRNGIFASLNQTYHVALVGWWRPMYRLTKEKP